MIKFYGILSLLSITLNDLFSSKKEEEVDTIQVDYLVGHPLDSIPPKPSSKYYKALKEIAQQSDCFCSKKVFFKIEVDDLGNLNNVELIRGTGTCWDDEVEKIILDSSPWHPSQVNGENISSEIVLPVYIGTVITYECQEPN
ncbi:hypothetical protein [Flammeovirga kamogawensis]|uniref:TonB C-terminal domain-containing protein n=1 Tax=Flammeovirga kamogawensis TaxID=373891 RepID=A0ABX8H3B9_9BACT|nr:hypothetical protein [Flammeovirga kamogawensis]MBB6460514.1 hypothetical protein [Flammeovirga kamogawensis]QWG10320.1 hypothetical protein KM029_21795 [Flammeovirga kamogawensis]TRX64766.1 hypothetical protein EO216_19705 [Flammeovirga kamogawensis]